MTMAQLGMKNIIYNLKIHCWLVNCSITKNCYNFHERPSPSILGQGCFQCVYRSMKKHWWIFAWKFIQIPTDRLTDSQDKPFGLLDYGSWYYCGWNGKTLSSSSGQKLPLWVWALTVLISFSFCRHFLFRSIFRTRSHEIEFNSEFSSTTVHWWHGLCGTDSPLLDGMDRGCCSYSHIGSRKSSYTLQTKQVS